MQSHTFSARNAAQAHFQAGQQAMADHRWTEAAEEFQQAIDQDPRFAAAYGSLGITQAELGKLDDASESFRHATRLEPNRPAYHAGLASVYARELRFAEAAQEFSRVVQLDPKDVNAYYNLGLAYLGTSSYKQAVEQLERASQIDPSSPEILINLTRAELLAGDSVRAARQAESIEARWGNSPQVLYSLGLALGRSQACSLAAPALDQAWTLMPAETAIGLELTRCRLDLHDFGQARDILLRLRAESRDTDELESLLGSAYAGLGASDAALEIFRQAVVLNSRNAEAHYQLGELLLRKEDFSGAVAELEHADRLAPGDVRFVSSLGRALIQSRRNEDAFEFLAKELGGFPRSAELPYLLGLAYYNLGRYSQALANFEKARELSTGDPRVYFMLANASADAGDYAKAERAYQDAIRVDSKTYIYYNYFASLLGREGKLHEAVECLKKSIALQPNVSPSYYALGKVYVLLGKYQEAVEQLRKSVELDPPLAPPYYLLAACYTRIGDQRAAREYRKRFASMSARSRQEEYLNLSGDFGSEPLGLSPFARAPAARNTSSPAQSRTQGPDEPSSDKR